MRKLAIYCCMLMFLWSCTESEVMLAREDFKLIDSLYNQEKNILQPDLDQQCQSFRDSVLQLWIDSIMIKRQSEIEKLINQ